MLQAKGEVCWLASASQPSVFIRDDVYCNCIGTRTRDGPRDCMMICGSIKGEPPHLRNAACILMTQNISPRDAWPPKMENTCAFVGLPMDAALSTDSREDRRGHPRHNVVLARPRPLAGPTPGVGSLATYRCEADMRAQSRRKRVRFGAEWPRSAHVAEALRKVVKTSRQF
jgi:hypothetical protein